MNIHEFQAKQLFSQFNIPVPRGKAVASVEEAKAWAEELRSSVYVVKAQIHAGGRGKAGGVKLTKDRAQVETLARELLGKVLVTHQTGPEGRKVQRLLIEEGADIASELYVSLLVDRASGWPVFIASRAGGMEIEEVAAHSPEKILKAAIDPSSGYQAFHGRMLAFRLGLGKEVQNPFVQMLGHLYRLFMEKGATLIEINPLVITRDQKLIALDAKVTFDDNALYRNDDIKALRDLDEEDPLEVRASQYGLNYVKLDGEIGCMVNGAGLAMATMDAIKLAGSFPANFLDVGGGASKETVKQAFTILMSDSHVKGVFINIFGGIVRCERIAGGVIDAAKEVSIRVPLVVRLEGTNAEEARQMLAASGLNLVVVRTMWEGAQKIVSLIRR
ncbi:MAG: ADP-forming succinate--CoA ligase subunit beta [Nitrospirae bacterium]|nr:ADP-forming succinate--CoA ligase subunit beta [Nitrospirota bacterium]